MTDYRVRVEWKNYTRYNTSDLEEYMGDLISATPLKRLIIEVDYLCLTASEAQKSGGLSPDHVVVSKKRGCPDTYRMLLLRPDVADALLPPIESLALANATSRRMSKQYMELLGNEMLSRIFYVSEISESCEMIRVEKKCAMQKVKKPKEEREAEIRKTLTKGNAVYNMKHDADLLRKIAARYHKQHKIYRKQQERAAVLGIESTDFASVGLVLDRIKTGMMEK